MSDLKNACKSLCADVCLCVGPAVNWPLVQAVTRCHCKTARRGFSTPASGDSKLWMDVLNVRNLINL